MNEKDTLTLKAACEGFVNDYIPSPPSAVRSLAVVDINLLAQKILQLPEIDQSLVFYRYYFGLGPAATGEILVVANPKARLDCCAELLAVALGLGAVGIDDASMESATRRAMGSYMAEYRRDEGAQLRLYSAALRSKLDATTTFPHRGGRLSLFAKRLAAAVLVAAMLVTTALAASPALRKLVFDWVVYTFPKYSQIGAANVDREPTEEDFAILKQYYPTYVPEGYTLHEVVEMFPSTIYDYRNDSEDMLFLYGSLQDESLTYYNSEGATIETLAYLGQPAFYWEQDGSTFFIWQQDGFQFSVIGKISKAEAIKMAESTKLQK